ncbi:MAG: polysaccharide deacetylase family protein [Clostridiales bacterium]|nr:polysaccharide deacetylase family protein [Clostridiales bacterium]
MKKIIALALFLSVLLCSCTANTGTSDAESSSTGADATDGSSTTNVAETTLTASEMLLSFSQYSTESVTWGSGNITDHERPAEPTALQNKYSELGGQWLLEDEKVVCLTFDEGYENGYTADILDTLKEKGVCAIFFCTYDYVKDNPELVNRMINEGHILGNHSYSHYNMTETDVDTTSDEITILHDYVAEYFSYEMTYFRFPEGAFSEQSLAVASSLGYKSVFWSFAYADWDTSAPPSEEEAFEKITSSTHNGAIILLHAVCEANAAVLGDVIDEIESQGYTFTTEL